MMTIVWFLVIGLVFYSLMRGGGCCGGHAHGAHGAHGGATLAGPATGPVVGQEHEHGHEERLADE